MRDLALGLGDGRGSGIGIPVEKMDDKEASAWVERWIDSFNVEATQFKSTLSFAESKISELSSQVGVFLGPLRRGVVQIFFFLLRGPFKSSVYVFGENECEVHGFYYAPRSSKGSDFSFCRLALGDEPGLSISPPLWHQLLDPLRPRRKKL